MSRRGARVSTLLWSVAMGIAATSIITVAAPRHAPAQEREATTFVVLVQHLRSDSGLLRGAVYPSPDAWLREGREIADCQARIVAGTARCVLSVTGPQRLAFAALHDEDDDGQLDRDIFGLPREGYAFSNDAREPFGPPSFAAASFDVTRPRTLVVHARYGL